MLLTPPLGEEQFPVPLPSVPVGGRLTQFLHHWEKFTTDVWVLSVIRGGLDLVFQERPPLSDSPIPMSQTSDKEKFRLLSEEVQSLLLKRVIEEIPLTQSMEISIRKVQFGGQHTWKNTSSDRSVGLPDLRQGEVPSSVRGSSISSTEKSNRGNSSDSVTPGFYSRLFLVPKKTGGMRPVIDLSILNSYLSVPHFKMGEL
jgi:hypothetical protein